MGTMVTIVFASIISPQVDLAIDKEINRLLTKGRQHLVNAQYDDAIRCGQTIFEQPKSRLGRCSNHFHHACQLISEAYDYKNDGERSLYYSRQARDVYRLRSFCGTCDAQREKSMDEQIEKLKTKYDLPDHPSDVVLRSKFGNKTGAEIATENATGLVSRLLTFFGVVFVAISCLQIRRMRRFHFETNNVNLKKTKSVDFDNSDL